MQPRTQENDNNQNEAHQALLQPETQDHSMTVKELEHFPPNGHSPAAPENEAETSKEKTGESPDSEKADVDLDMDEDDSEYDLGIFGRFIEKIENAIGAVFSKYGTLIGYGVKTLLFLAYIAYFSFSMYRSFGDEDSTMLLVITAIVVLIVANKLMTAKGLELSLPEAMKNCLSSNKAKKIRKVIRYLLYLVAAAGITTFLGLEILQYHPSNAQSFFGMFGLLLICFVCSAKPSRVNWHPVFWGCVIQFCFASLTLRTKVGYDIFAWMGKAVEDFTNYSDAGAAFVIGKDFETMGLAFAFAGVIIFYNAVIFLLNHWGVIEFIVVKLGYFLSLCMETGPVESVIAAANIFIGLAEAPLLIRPYLATVTKSEIHTIMTCGFASIAGSTMGIFIRFGAPSNHLLTAAVISAPAALAVSKLIYPETKKVDFSKQRNIQMRDPNAGRNALSACADGAVMAITLIGAIMANMLAFFSLLAMMNTFLTWFGERAGYDGLTFEKICSWVLYPISFFMGVEPNDCGQVGALIGTKLFATPMLGYAKLGVIIKNRHELEDYLANDNGTWHWEGLDVILDGRNKTLQYGVMSERSEIISTYAMCGFSAFTAIGICLGCLIPLCPQRKKLFVELVFRAFLAGNMASFLTGAVAGVMHSG